MQPQTSRAAYEAIKPRKANHHKIITETMRKIGRPCTAEQISVKCALNYYQVQRRLSEMNNVYRTQLRGVNSSGATAVKWDLKDSTGELF